MNEKISEIVIWIALIACAILTVCAFAYAVCHKIWAYDEQAEKPKETDKL